MTVGLAIGLLLCQTKGSVLNSSISSGGPVICIDPGHPSEVSNGTKGRLISEVHAAWQVALKLKDILIENGYRVVMTKKSENEFVTNRRRAEIANQSGAKLMIRLHCDDGKHSGLATYYPDRAATILGRHGPSKEVLGVSKKYAKVFHSATVGALDGAIGDAGLHTERQSFVGGKQGALTGSVFSNVPVLLVEMAVLSNSTDDKFISSVSGQKIMARSISMGIRAIFSLIGQRSKSIQ